MERLTTLPAALPADTARLTLSADSIERLPEGAAFVVRKGRVGLSVSRGKAPGTVSIEATADSVSALLSEERTAISRTASGSSSQSVRTAAERPSTEQQRPWRRWLMALLVIGGTAGLISLTMRVAKFFYTRN